MDELRFGPPRSDEELLDARRLQAQVYADYGYVDHLPNDGVLLDRWTPHSRFFIAADDATGRIVGTCREIAWTTEHRLPTIEAYDLDIAQSGLAELVESGRLSEISALATDKRSVPQPLAVSAGLYRAMWQEQMLDPRSDAWIFSIEPWLLQMFRDALGFVVEELGPPRYYYGADCVPVLLTLQDGAQQRQMWATRPAAAAWFTDGLPEHLKFRLSVLPQPAKP